MVRPARQPPTFEELYQQIQALPEGVTGQILVPGVLSTMSRPARPHRYAAKKCDGALRGIDRNWGGTGWWIEIEAEIRFPNGRLAVPDLAGWRVERVPELPDENPLTVLPDWCAEFLSLSTTRQDRLLKLPMYATYGVEWTWIVDADLHTVEVYRARDGHAVLEVVAMDDAEVVLPPFDLPIALGAWWLPSPTVP